MTRLLWIDQINRPFDAIPQSRDSSLGHTWYERLQRGGGLLDSTEVRADCEWRMIAPRLPNEPRGREAAAIDGAWGRDSSRAYLDAFIAARKVSLMRSCQPGPSA
ncbi:hypothetical protein AGR1B_pAt30370 [Agrobacterium fabacearum S56]|nr:hypothetical protein AGR1B_pAt30370 [Agrobacterium fabacearum S56]